MQKPCVPDSLPPKGIDWGALVSRIGAANAGVARFDGFLQSVVNPTLLLSPLRTQEAVLSSRIEGTQATLGEVLAYEAMPDPRSPRAEDIQEVINYRDAMDMAVEALHVRPISLNLLRDIHNVLLSGVRGRNKARGEFRTVQNYIGARGASIEQASFIPPEPAVLMQCLSDWEHYVHADERDPIVQAAVVHGQFEVIHPFLDGNGRVGRILIPLFLFEKGVLSSPMFYLSAYFEAHRSEYCDRLLAITEQGDWQGWIAFFLDAVIEQARENTAKAKAIQSLYDEMKVRIPEVTRSQYAISILDAIFQQPHFTATEFMDRTGLARRTATRLVGLLRDAEIVAPLREGRGQNPSTLVFTRLVEICDI